MKKALTQAEKATAKQAAFAEETITHLVKCEKLGVVAPYMEYDELMHWVGGEYPPQCSPAELAQIGLALHQGQPFTNKPTNEKVTFEHVLGGLFCTLTTGGDLVLWK